MPINATLITTEDLDALKAEITADFVRIQRTQLLNLFQIVQQVITDCQVNLATDPDLGAQASQTHQSAADAGQQVRETAAGVANGTATQADVDALKATIRDVTEQVTELKAEHERRISVLEADMDSIKGSVAALETANDATEQWKVTINDSHQVLSDTVDSVRVDVAALQATATDYNQWKVTVDNGLASQATTLANHDAALTNHTAAINSIGVALNGTQAAAGQTAVIGLRERTLNLETEVDKLKEAQAKNSFNVWIFLIVVATLALIGAIVGWFFAAWVLGLMVGGFIGAIAGFIAAIKVKHVLWWKYRTPAQPAPGTPPAPPAPAQTPAP